MVQCAGTLELLLLLQVHCDNFFFYVSYLHYLLYLRFVLTFLGGGALCNGQKIHVSNTDAVSNPNPKTSLVSEVVGVFLLVGWF